jgi:glutamine synthetase
MAGLDGIANRIMPPARVNGNIFAMTEEERAEAGIENLPYNLMAAIEELEKDEFIRDVLGKHISEKYIAAKWDEWNRSRPQVSQWEIQEYLYKY